MQNLLADTVSVQVSSQDEKRFRDLYGSCRDDIQRRQLTTDQNEIPAFSIFIPSPLVSNELTENKVTFYYIPIFFLDTLKNADVPFLIF